MEGAVKRSEDLRRAPDIVKLPKDMSITERLYYLRERGYGVKTVGCIELAKLGRQLSDKTITRPQFLKGIQEIALAMEAMIRDMHEEKSEAEMQEREVKSKECETQEECLKCLE